MRSMLCCVVLLGCGFETVKQYGAGPVCEEAAAPAPTCADTVSAFEIIDATLMSAGLREVAVFSYTSWVAGESFISADGRHLNGHVGPNLRIYRDGFTICDIHVATRNQDKVSRTSLAHEALHCTLPLSGRKLDGDPDHTLPHWRPCPDPPIPGCDLLGEMNRSIAASEPYQDPTRSAPSSE